MLKCSLYDRQMFLFFFFKQKTAYEMRISDWSSDVCSSDLAVEIDMPDRQSHFGRGVALDPAIDRRMVDRNAAFRQHFLKVAIAGRIATIPAHRTDRKRVV